MKENYTPHNDLLEYGFKVVREKDIYKEYRLSTFRDSAVVVEVSGKTIWISFHLSGDPAGTYVANNYKLENKEQFMFLLFNGMCGDMIKKKSDPNHP